MFSLRNASQLHMVRHNAAAHRALEQLEKEEAPRIREALRVQMMEFGRTPRQLFSKPHPKRKVHFDGRRGACSCLAPAAPRHPQRPINILSPQQ